LFQILNKTAFQASLGLFTDQYGADKVVVAIKGTFTMPKDSVVKIKLADEQLPVLYCDEYFGEPKTSSIKYPADMVLGKVGTDIGLVGHAYSNNGALIKQIPVSITVGELQKNILVVGDRHWEENKLMPGFSISEPAFFTKMPLLFERAFGGYDQSHKNEKDHRWNRENPIGTGFRINKDAVANHLLPNLEDPKNLISHWNDKPPVMGFGFIDSSWEPRIKYAGTYDKDWQKNQSPLLPIDFKIDFFNSASAGLRSQQFVCGGEDVRLENVSQRGLLHFKLPQINIRCTSHIGDTHNTEDAQLWTLLFEPDEERFYLVWGKSFPIGKQLTKMKSVKVEIEGESIVDPENWTSE